jgi:hypothetical protein
MSYNHTRNQHKEDSSGWGRNFRKSAVRGRNPKEISVIGSSPIHEVTFSIDFKRGEIHQMQDKELDV